MSSKAAFHNKYCLCNWSYDQEVTWWFSRPDLVFLLSYRFHRMRTFTFFESFNTYAWIFYEFLGILPSTEGKGIIKSNEQNFFSYYAINHRSWKMSIISIIEVHKISPKELNMYLAEFIRSFRLKDRQDYEPSGWHALLQVLRGIHQDMKIAWNDSAVKLGCSEKTR